MGATPADAMTPEQAFAAICLAAVASDGVVGRDEARSLRIELEFRTPYVGMDEATMAGLFDDLLELWRSEGSEALVAKAAPCLNQVQRETALAVAIQLVRADRIIEPEEVKFIDQLAGHLDLPETMSQQIITVMDILHRDSLAMADE